MDELEPSLHSGNGNRRRRRPHDATIWAEVQSPLKHYYIELDMTLRDAMQKIEDEHGFRATEQMYKKRLRAWGMSKHIKSGEKERALVSLLNNEPVSGELATTRPDKLVRYAKSRIKSAVSSRKRPESTKQRDCQDDIKRQMTYPVVVEYSALMYLSHKGTEIASVPLSPNLPDEFARFDLFLRAMQELIGREREEWLTGQQLSPDAIFVALSNGMACWRRNAFTTARKFFGQAARRMKEDLQGAVVVVSRITYCISSIFWGSQHELVFIKFVEFMSNVAFEVLGQQCPLTLVLSQLREEPSVQAQLRIWECALDDYRISEQNLDHWWDMARRRWRWCWSSGMIDLATRYRDHAIGEARQINMLTEEMELEAERDVEFFGLQQGARS